MYEGKFEDDIKVGVNVRLRNGMTGTVTSIDERIGTYGVQTFVVKTFGIHELTYKWGSFKHSNSQFDIINLVPSMNINDGNAAIQEAAKLRYGSTLSKPSTEVYKYNSKVEPEEEPLPEWATGLVPEDMIVTSQQLLTKDGRVTGNAVIFDIAYNIELGEPIFYCITDAGNIIKLTASELNQMFYHGKYIMADYPGDPDGTKLEYWEY